MTLGEESRKWIERDEKVMAKFIARVSPLVAIEGRGAIVKDVDGKEYIDFSSGIGVVNTGHCHPKVVEAVKRQVEKLIHIASTDFYHPLQVELAEKLVEITPGEFKKRVFFTNSGTESVECAIKITRNYRKRSRIIGFIGGFHGRTMGSLAITSGKSIQRSAFSPVMPEAIHVPYAYCYRCRYKLEYPECDVWCAKYIEEVVFNHLSLPEDVSAILIEPIQGEGGYIVPPKEFLSEIQSISERYSIPLIVDEVQSGFGRTGKMFASEHFGIVGDVLTLAKALASGLPMGACVSREEIMDMPPGTHGNTFGGNPVSAAAALATIEVIEEEKLVDNAAKVGELMISRLREMMEKYEIIGDVRGLGLMIGVELVKDRESKEPAKKEVEEVILNSLKEGLILLPAGISSIRFAPPLVIDEETAENGLEIFERVLAEIS